MGVVWAGQTALGEAVQGRQSMPVTQMVQGALNQTLPWIPVTLFVLWIGARYPITRTTWRRRLPLHLVLAAACSWMANVLVVLGFWMTTGNFRGLGTLARSAAVWGTVNFHVALLIYATVLAG